MTSEEFIPYLWAKVQEYGTQRELALALGISPAFLGDVLHRRRDPGQKLVKALGLRKVVSYEWITEQER